MKFTRPGRLIGPRVLLEPLGPEHREPLRAVAAIDQSIWTYFPIDFNGAGKDFDLWFDYTLDRFARDEHFPFAVLQRRDCRVVGTTRFYDMAANHRRLAIGSTWYAPTARGTLINPEVRLVTLTHAFEQLGVNRVELITDPHNLSSRAAMKLLGAVEEGVIRSHMIYNDGRVRDSVLFSIIRSEWPCVRERLMTKLGYSEDAVGHWPTIDG
jgi:RimJ/RimL family protein N-acetyltransferase